MNKDVTAWMRKMLKEKESEGINRSVLANYMGKDVSVIGRILNSRRLLLLDDLMPITRCFGEGVPLRIFQKYGVIPSNTPNICIGRDGNIKHLKFDAPIPITKLSFFDDDDGGAHS